MKLDWENIANTFMHIMANLPIWQLVPAYPGRHWHLYVPCVPFGDPLLPLALDWNEWINILYKYFEVHVFNKTNVEKLSIINMINKHRILNDLTDFIFQSFNSMIYIKYVHILHQDTIQMFTLIPLFPWDLDPFLLLDPLMPLALDWNKWIHILYKYFEVHVFNKTNVEKLSIINMINKHRILNDLTDFIFQSDNSMIYIKYVHIVHQDTIQMFTLIPLIPLFPLDLDPFLDPFLLLDPLMPLALDWNELINILYKYFEAHVFNKTNVEKLSIINMINKLINIEF